MDKMRDDSVISFFDVLVMFPLSGAICLTYDTLSYTMGSSKKEEGGNVPKQTFFNLSDAKRKRIIHAARHELTQHDFSELSINRIVKEAEISRGSFYMYFEDKHDLMAYFVNTFAEKIHQRMMMLMNESHGSLEVFAHAFQAYLVRLFKNSENQNLLRHMMLYFQTNVEHNFRHPETKACYERLETSFVEAWDDPRLKRHDKDYRRAILRLLLNTVHQNIMEHVVMEKTYEDIDKDLTMTMKIIQSGYLQKESDEHA
jgi:AcrR family transcriptional regulator